MQLERELSPDGVATVRLAWPERGNALSPEGLQHLLAMLQELQAEGSGARVIVLTGTGAFFSSGADLAALSGADPGRLGDTVRQLTEGLYRCLTEGRLPSLAAVNGVAVGGGAGLALLCDIVVAAHSAKFVLSFARMGLVPDSLLTHILPRAMGEPRARAVAMLGETLTAEEAAAQGLIYRAVPDEAFAAEIGKLAKRLAAQPAGIHRDVRALLAAARDTAPLDQIAREAEAQGRAVESPAFRQAASAFLAKTRGG